LRYHDSRVCERLGASLNEIIIWNLDRNPMSATHLVEIQKTLVVSWNLL
jgi:hypothetical protein